MEDCNQWDEVMRFDETRPTRDIALRDGIFHLKMIGTCYLLFTSTVFCGKSIEIFRYSDSMHFSPGHEHQQGLGF